MYESHSLRHAGIGLLSSMLFIWILLIRLGIRRREKQDRHQSKEYEQRLQHQTTASSTTTAPAAVVGVTYGAEATAATGSTATIATISTSTAPPGSTVGTAASAERASVPLFSNISDDRLADEIIEMGRKRNALQAALHSRIHIQGSQRRRTRKEQIALHDYNDDGHEGGERNNHSSERTTPSGNVVTRSTTAPPSASSTNSNTGHVFIEVARSERKKCMFCKTKQTKYRCCHPLCWTKTFEHNNGKNNREGIFYCPQHQHIHHGHVQACTLADEVWK